MVLYTGKLWGLCAGRWLRVLGCCLVVCCFAGVLLVILFGLVSFRCMDLMAASVGFRFGSLVVFS